MPEEALTNEEKVLVAKVVGQLEFSYAGRCSECGKGRLFHLIRPLECDALVGMLRARLE